MKRHRFPVGEQHTGEVLGLTWPRGSIADGEVRLAPEESKTGEARVFPMTDALRAILTTQREATDGLQRTRGSSSRRCSTTTASRSATSGRRGASACIAAGLFRVVGVDAEGEPIKAPPRLFHDFRRSAVRRFEQAGFTRGVAMKFTGHKTESVYRRCAIVSVKDLLAAAATLASGAHGHNWGHTRTATVRTLHA